MAKNSVLDYSNIPDNNTDMGGIGIQGASAVNNFDNAFRTFMSQIAKWTDGSTIASGTTTDLSTVEGMYVSITGASTITSFGTAKAGWIKFVRFTGAATITHNATSMILPGGASITAAAGDTAAFVSDGSGNWRCLFYTPVTVKSFTGYISPNFNLVYNTSDQITFPSGSVAADGPIPILMVHPSGTVSLGTAFGTGSGGRFDSAVANGTWHCFVISNGTLVSRGFSQALNPTTQPNYPAGFPFYRRVGSVIRSAGAIRSFVQREDHFDYSTPPTERSSTAGQAETLLALGVPFGIVTQPKLASQQQQAAAGNAQTFFGSAGGSTSPYVITTAAGDTDSAVIPGGVFTDTSSRIQFAVEIFSGSLSLNSLITLGWIDTRGRA
ncbi:hypothetical protein [Agrobacterium radiobacter]|uniref:hypothetical protein n=1 Tax=Agrobacterium radiobacter TaxID=362 RepID=UPI001606D3FF|nr:hypothetical protein [Agrobacterium radiobacter]MBB4407104.1 hypothetical protein [Agrobacterium radiobacter]MBB4452692.1 hypothetical protein [Agrobacterium radiobacter]